MKRGESTVSDVRALTIAVIILYLGTVLFVLLYVLPVATRNTDALCALRTDLGDRVETSQQILIDHPNGVAGLDSDTIQSSIDSQLRTIEALSAVTC